jgi:late competence protein required for DNA uptake (superfamily II DNA/RNA helicase)
MKQAEQKEVLNAFRRGDFNVLVATCIGEEGLDIPEVGVLEGRKEVRGCFVENSGARTLEGGRGDGLIELGVVE